MAARINLQKPQKREEHTHKHTQRHTNTPASNNNREQWNGKAAMICRRQFPKILDFNHCGAEFKVKSEEFEWRMPNGRTREESKLRLKERGNPLMK